MDTALKEAIWQQFGASIDTLSNTIEVCPDNLWADRNRNPEYWYTVYHCLFWLDLYLTGKVEDFSPPDPFGLAELDPAGILPPQVYTREEMLSYTAHCREKGSGIIASLTPESAKQLCKFGWGEVPYTELLLYNMRHVQHHAAQLNLILRQTSNEPARWVARAG
jgi:hypothetical protein